MMKKFKLKIFNAEYFFMSWTQEITVSYPAIKPADTLHPRTVNTLIEFLHSLLFLHDMRGVK